MTFLAIGTVGVKLNNARRQVEQDLATAAQIRRLEASPAVQTVSALQETGDVIREAGL